jgi:hypothetical protein
MIFTYFTLNIRKEHGGIACSTDTKLRPAASDSDFFFGPIKHLGARYL